MKKLLLVLALVAFSPLSFADSAKANAKDIAEAIEEILENNGKVPASETAKAVKELKLSVRNAVLEGLISRAEGSNALNGLENALKRGGGNPVSPS